jgi:Sec-independent protein translocase protein TatA
LSRIIVIAAVIILSLFVLKLIRLLRNFGSASRSNVNGLKDRASHLKNKFKDIQEADFTEIPPDEDIQSSEKDNGK